MSVWGAIGLLGATTTLAGLPLAPALWELRHRTDAAPLPTRNDEGDVRAFARSFRTCLAPMLPLLAAAEANRETLPASLPDGTPAMLVGVPGCLDTFSTMNSALLCAEDAFIPAGSRLLRELYVRGRLVGARDVVMRAALVEGDTELGEGAIVLRWLHTEGRLAADAGAQLYGRISAGREIQLAPGCRFERMSAKTIICGAEHAPSRRRVPAGRSIVDLAIGRLRTIGDLHLGPGDGFQGHLVSMRSVRIDGGVRVLGSTKSHRATWLGDGAEVHGALVSGEDAYIASGCFVDGPLLCERTLTIGPGSEIGTQDSPTTISAPRIRIAPGAVLHGTVWAREYGAVEE